MFYRTSNWIIMPFYIYKSYQHEIRQHLYINIKNISMKTQHHTLYAYIIKSVVVAPPFA